MRKIYLRLLPFAVLSYFLAYIDRINVSFAGLTMRDDLNMSAAAFGFALGTFYWGYFIFEVPSNLIMEKVGARLWIARIMITWGILAGITATVTGSTSFGIVRFLLGVAEAGFFPGILLFYLLVPELSPCPHRLGLSDRVAGGGGTWSADLHRLARPRRLVRSARLADHVPR
jgi:ACS family tartrate transporter-like MFS transporter